MKGHFDIFVGSAVPLATEIRQNRPEIAGLLEWGLLDRFVGAAIMSSIVPGPGTELHRVFEMLLRSADAASHGSPLTLREMLESVEKAALHDALMRTRGNRARAARLLGATERVFNYSVRKYGIDWRRYKT